MKDPFGNYVVQKVLESCDDRSLELILSRIRVHLNSLKRYTYGKHIVSRVEKLITTGGEAFFSMLIILDHFRNVVATDHDNDELIYRLQKGELDNHRLRSPPRRAVCQFAASQSPAAFIRENSISFSCCCRDRREMLGSDPSADMITVICK